MDYLLQSFLWRLRFFAGLFLLACRPRLGFDFPPLIHEIRIFQSIALDSFVYLLSGAVSVRDQTKLQVIAHISVR